MDSNAYETDMKQLRKELRMTRIFCAITSLLTLALLVGGIFLYGQIKPAIELLEDAQPVLEELAQLDVNSVNQALEQVSTTLGSVDWNQISDAVGSVDWKQVSDAIGSVDWQQVSDSLAKLDVEAMNEAITGLDTEELSEAIENLNNAANTLKGIGDKLSSFTGWFGN